MSIKGTGLVRVNNILMADKKRTTDIYLNEVIKCDILNVLNNYFEIKEHNCTLSVDTLSDGNIYINMTVCAVRGRDFWKV